MPTSSETNPTIPTLENFSRMAGVIALLVGGLVLTGWIAGVPEFKNLLTGLATMKVNTALAFILAGLGLLAFSGHATGRWARWIGLGCALAIAVLGLVTLCEYFFHWSAGIDELFFHDVIRSSATIFPGRMSVTAALNFVFFGAALFLLDRRTPQGDWISQLLGVIVSLSSGLAALGYIFGATEFYGLGAYNQIAVHTALTFLILATGLLCARPRNGLMTGLTSKNAGSALARRLLPAAILVPVALGWLTLQGLRGNFYDVELGIAILVSSSIAVSVALIGWNARQLNWADLELRRAQAADLRASEERLRYVVWATRDAVWDRDLASGKILWNDGLQKLLHYKSNEIEPTVLWWEQHIHPDDRARVTRSIQSILETKQQLWSKEYRFERSDGTYANIFDRAYVIYDEPGREPQRMIGAMADMTDQKQIELALRQSEELFAKAFSATPAGIILTQVKDGRFIEANEAYLNLVEYSRTEVLEHTPRELEIISAEDQGRMIKLFSEHGSLRDFELWIATKSGQRKAVLSSLEQVEVGGVACILSVIYDITERKQAEAAHQRSETLFRTLFELSPESVLVLDPHDPDISWPILDCNAAACVMNGYERDELIGQSIDLLNGTRSTQEERDAYMKLLRENAALHAEFRHVHKNGTIFPIESSVTLVYIDGRELAIGIDRDITARQRDELALREANEKLAEGLLEVKERNREGVLLNEMGYLLQGCTDAEKAYEAISLSAAQLFPNAMGSLCMMNSARTLVEPVASWNGQEPDTRAFAPEECLALQENQTHFVDPDIQNLQCGHVLGSPQSSLCIPMHNESEVLGIFHLQYPADKPLLPRSNSGGLSQSDLRLAMTVGDTISLALSNLRLRETLRIQSIRDPLTGLYNRRFMEESLQHEMNRARRSSRTVGIIMLDLDRFKSFNDNFGHEAGDILLQDLGSFLQASIRSGDIACRYGGEEFLLLLPEASLEITRQRAQKLCDEIRVLQVPYRGQLLGAVTLSAGVAAFPEHGELGADVVRAADQALYRAKRAGRDQVAVARHRRK